jgi:galactokinase
MCDIARTVPGVLGERMLGGGDKGASGVIVKSTAVKALRKAVGLGYPRSHPECAESFAIHDCRIVDGVVDLEL